MLVKPFTVLTKPCPRSWEERGFQNFLAFYNLTSTDYFSEFKYLKQKQNAQYAQEAKCMKYAFITTSLEQEKTSAG